MRCAGGRGQSCEGGAQENGKKVAHDDRGWTMVVKSLLDMGD